MEGTYDDGLPATWNDFVFLMEEMIRRGITPFTWANMSYYRTAMLKALWANYEGYDDYLLNYSFNGTHSSLGEIREDNGYILQNQGGKRQQFRPLTILCIRRSQGKKRILRGRQTLLKAISRRRKSLFPAVPRLTRKGTNILSP